VLLDAVPDARLESHIRGLMELDGDRVCDLHVWQVGPGHLAVMVSVVSEAPRPPAAYKQRLAGLAGLSHVTVEVHALPQ
jgi:Co/Zn/Cd efflux system component